ncbi:hypothetical protein PHYBOEH_002763 [Phytophthora boehmeriae]|uniref:C2H2-type domain-containing protein n=1 Tax=Phytophthora boehmeriae TaxID=109152 RepID=A0A8T1WV45_9STRA|nr:hypothetical protein PHYBOEH_002763 [Phytophthora boehmeriae]
MASPLSHSTTNTASPADSRASGLNELLFHHCSEPGCLRRFSRKYSLSEHMKTHTGEKPHVCPVRTCAKRFTTSGNLARHKRLHGYIEPLKCPVDGCICTFPSEMTLEKHMKFHYGGPVHLCEVPGCGKTFSTTGNLNRHFKSRHLSETVGGAQVPAAKMALVSPTTVDAWQPPTTQAPHRLKRAWSTGTNPLPMEPTTNFNRECVKHLGMFDDTMDDLSTLLIEIGLDSIGGSDQSNLLDDMIRFHIEDLS